MVSENEFESNVYTSSGRDEEDVDISVNIAGMHMQNPVMVSSGTFGYGLEYQNALGYGTENLGAMVLKSVTYEPRPGNSTPRCVETYGGLLNAIGLQNIGVRSLVSGILPLLRQFRTNIVVNIAGSSVQEYGQVAEVLSTAARSDFSAVEINVSCPNVKEGGIQFGMECSSVSEVVRVVRTQLPEVTLITKLTPNAPNIAEIALACVEAGSDGVALINTLPGMAIDIHTRRPILANISGGLSGPAIKPVALFKVFQVAQAFRVKGVRAPIIGMGGICTASDAIEFILAGASAVSIGTANFYDPDCCPKIVEGIRHYLKVSASRGDVRSMRELIGGLQLSRTEQRPAGRKRSRTAKQLGGETGDLFKLAEESWG